MEGLLDLCQFQGRLVGTPRARINQLKAARGTPPDKDESWFGEVGRFPSKNGKQKADPAVRSWVEFPRVGLENK